MLKETNKKYVTVYTEDEANIAYKIGDATYETSGWHDDYAYFVDSYNPFFGRGGHFSLSSDAGVFYFDDYYGSAAGSISFRMCLAVK